MSAGSSKKIWPVILCGGHGTRLWPLSRKSYPKQFCTILGTESLFQNTVRRLCGPEFLPPIVLTQADFRFIVTEQIDAISAEKTDIIIEPEARDTAPAVLAAALYLAKKDPNALMLVAPSDHVIPDVETFHAAVQAGVNAAAQGELITFGIKPDRAETGYGYLGLAKNNSTAADAPIPQLHKLACFVEKPDLKTAEKMLASGQYLWNAGIFLFSAQTVIKAFETYAPQICTPCQLAVDGARVDLEFLRLAPEPWSQADAISVDYAVMEHAKNLSVISYNQAWSDLGSWEAVWQASGPDAENQVVSSDNATAIDCSNTLLRSESESQQLVGIGLKDIIAVAMPDAVLVADMSDAQNVKTAVTTLKANAVKQAETLPRDHRPWGWFETLSLGTRFQVKRIMVHPGASLSLQSHVHRAEHWVVVQGAAKVTIGEDKKLLGENQSIYIPLGAVHRLENPGKVDLHLIEVQTGAYLGEDDITRYDDAYSRT